MNSKTLKSEALNGEHKLNMESKLLREDDRREIRERRNYNSRKLMISLNEALARLCRLSIWE